MTQNEALILDHLQYIRAAIAEIAEDIGAIKASLTSTEKHVRGCSRPRLPFVLDAPSVASA